MNGVTGEYSIRTEESIEGGLTYQGYGLGPYRSLVTAHLIAPYGLIPLSTDLLCLLLTDLPGCSYVV